MNNNRRIPLLLACAFAVVSFSQARHGSPETRTLLPSGDASAQRRQGTRSRGSPSGDYLGSAPSAHATSAWFGTKRGMAGPGQPASVEGSTTGEGSAASIGGQRPHSGREGVTCGPATRRHLRASGTTCATCVYAARPRGPFTSGASLFTAPSRTAGRRSRR